MRIKCPVCGSRDMREFQYLGDTKLLFRPVLEATDDPRAPEVQAAFHDYLHIRDNPAGVHSELWMHEAGCQNWLQATRDTITHEFGTVRLAQPQASTEK